MKYTDVNKFVQQNGLLTKLDERSGIYAITVDNQVVYIGKSQNMLERGKQHIYGIENATLTHEKRYELLLSAKLGGHTIDIVPVEYVDLRRLTDRENFYIDRLKPLLNIMTPTGRKDISALLIDDLLEDVYAREAYVETYGQI